MEIFPQSVFSSGLGPLSLTVLIVKVILTLCNFYILQPVKSNKYSHQKQYMDDIMSSTGFKSPINEENSSTPRVVINSPGPTGCLINSPGPTGCLINSPGSTGCLINSPGSTGCLINSSRTKSSTPAVSFGGCRRKLEYDYIWTQIDSLCNTSVHVGSLLTLVHFSKL